MQNKKIRTQLLNFINKELMYNKKSKKSKLLINSMTLDELEEKNLQCKDFHIKEKDQIYQNIDNGWIIGLNIYVNNIYHNNNPYIYSLSNLIRDNYIINDIKTINDKKINRIETIGGDKETIIQKKSSKILYILKEGSLTSPVDTSLLIKKEVGARKLKRNKNEYMSNKMALYNTGCLLPNDNSENPKEKDNEKTKDIINFNFNNNFNFSYDNEEFKLIKQLSKETIETDISRIIQACHDAKYANSSERFPSDTRISLISKETKLAKMYARKLKLYCRTLKRKIPLNRRNTVNSNNSNDYKFIFEEKVKEYNKNKPFEKNLKPIKEKTKKIKKIHSVKKENYNNSKYTVPIKKLKSEKNIKLMDKKNSFAKIIKGIENTKINNNNNISNSSKNNNLLATSDDKGNKKKYVKINKKKTKIFESEHIPQPRYKTKKDLSGISPKMRNTMKDLKKSNKNHKITNDLLSKTDTLMSTAIIHKKSKKKDNCNKRRKNKNSTEANKENNLKKLNKIRKKFEDLCKKKDVNNMKSNTKKRASIDKVKRRASIEKSKKRASVDTTKMNIPGFESINCDKTQSNSNNNSTSSQQKESSISIEKNKKMKIINIKNKNFIVNVRGPKEKKKTFGFEKRKRESIVIEALKKMKKRKTTNLDDIISFNSVIFSPNYKEEEKKIDNSICDSIKKNNNSKKKNNSKKNKTKTSKNIKESNNCKKNKEKDIRNLMDEFSAKKKHEKRKNVFY